MRTLAVAVVLLVAGGAAAAPGTTGAASTPSTAGSQSLTLAFDPPTLVFGARTVAHGRLVPAEAHARVVLERRNGPVWKVVGAARTDAGGRYAFRIAAGRTGVWRARVGATRSAAATLTVRPRLRVSAGPGIAFVGAPLLVRAQPATRASVLVMTLRSGREVARIRGRAGRRLLVPTPGVGAFTARIELGGRVVSVPLRASARTLSEGSTGPDVVALRRRLAQLGVHVPGPATEFGPELFDSVVAFQKARGLPRTGTADRTTWRALAQEVVPAPRYRGRGTHLEVSKSRQILIVVRDGMTVAYLPVSSGAGGITPVGNFSVLWKAPSTTTWLGSAILYRTMTIHGNVAIHGYHSVPTYPASHGCVRVPIWIADWLYRQTPVGERVYVYE